MINGSKVLIYLSFLFFLKEAILLQIKIKNSLVSDKVLAALGSELGTCPAFFVIHFLFWTVCFQIIVFLKCNPEILGLKHTSLPNIFLHIAWLLLPSGTMNNEFARAVLVNKAKKPFVHRTFFA